MSKRGNGSQLDFELSAGVPQIEKRVAAPVVPFVDAATLQIRRDAVRRVAANGIFALNQGPRRD